MPPVVVLPDLDISTEVSATDGHVELDFLLPNGIFIPLRVDYFDTIENVKQRLWKEAEKYPLYKKLDKKNNYSFMYVNQQGEKDEILDEDLTLNDFRLAARFLKLVERQPDDRKKTLERQTNALIGMKCQQCIETQQTPDINDFRVKMTTFCNEIVSRRHNDEKGLKKFSYKHPPRLQGEAFLPQHIRDRIKSGITLSVTIHESHVEYTMRQFQDSTPTMLLEEALKKWSNKTGMYRQDPNDYILKVVGLEDYIYGEHPLISFKYINSCLLTGCKPQLWLMKMSTVLEKHSGNAMLYQRKQSAQNLAPRPSVKRERGPLCWDIHAPFKIKIIAVSKITVSENSKVRMYAGLFHGPNSLCVMHTSDVIVYNGSCHWKKEVEFSLNVEDLPQSCRLCFTLHLKRGKELTLLTWVNIPVFNFKNRLIQGHYKLPMWPRQEHVELIENCNPIGTVSSNPQGEHATTLEFEVPNYDREKILYPSDEKVLQCASNNMEDPGKPGSPNWHPSKMHTTQFSEKLEEYQSGTMQMTEQDKELIWMMRYESRDRYPRALPLLLDSVSWDDHVSVAKMQALLQTWQKLDIEQALCLLDFNYPDTNVRKFACSCLCELSDDDLSQYMLQLVQALKYESHLVCPLAEFLLERALENQHLGHQLYWLLKSEIHDPSVTVRYGLILQVYLAANQGHLVELSKQQEVLLKLSALNSIAKNQSKTTKKVKIGELLSMGQKADSLSKFISPLSPLYAVGHLQTQKCKVMDSKKRPLWLEWTNSDPKGPSIHIMYKNGDDLRQDMLTLQIFQIMDNIWKSEGLDLRMNPYGCIATGWEEGMIEIVTKSNTIANIQRKKKGAFAPEVLYDWLKQQNSKEEDLSAAVEEFTYSCAGYAVATYILGIGDRHNGNIMLKENGQLFHIDFGHFLGNFKSKFNIKRERVPFILTSHFEYVIKKGDSDLDRRGVCKNCKTMNCGQNFCRFYDICERAYLIIRQHGQLLMRLFLMMLSAGIPQLMSASDVDYLKDTLALALSEEDAKKKFRSKFKEAQEKSWSTSLNWWFHIKAH